MNMLCMLKLLDMPLKGGSGGGGPALKAPHHITDCMSRVVHP